MLQLQPVRSLAALRTALVHVVAAVAEMCAPSTECTRLFCARGHARNALY